MSHDTINTLRKYHKLEDKFLCRICGKDVTTEKKEIMAACLQLNEVGSLPDETMINVLTGQRNCSVPNVVKLFGFLNRLKPC